MSLPDNLTERLRVRVAPGLALFFDIGILREAADRIEELEAALQQVAETNCEDGCGLVAEGALET